MHFIVSTYLPSISNIRTNVPDLRDQDPRLTRHRTVVNGPMEINNCEGLYRSQIPKAIWTARIGARRRPYFATY
jgi:hypothetical protein